MGSSTQVIQQLTCTSFLPSPLLPLPPPLAPLPTAPPPLTPPRSCPLSLLPTSMESLTTTPRLTSRRLRPRMPMVLSRAPSPSPSLTAVSRPQPTLLTMLMALLLRSPTRAPLSTPLSPREDMDMLPPWCLLLPLLTSLLLPTSLLGSKFYCAINNLLYLLKSFSNKMNKYEIL